MQLTTRAWRYLLWRAFAPEDRAQILRWAMRAKDEPPTGGSQGGEPPSVT